MSYDARSYRIERKRWVPLKNSLDSGDGKEKLITYSQDSPSRLLVYAHGRKIQEMEFKHLEFVVYIVIRIKIEEG